MLQVIDTGTSQWNLDFARAFDEGFRDCYVKMGGDNVDTYVAPWYVQQVDRARTAGFGHVGHYWVPDGNPADADTIDTPAQQADYMVDRLHDWRKPSDFIVLDNEPLDGAWMFTDAGAAEFIQRIKFRLGIPGRQVVMYGGWYDLAAHVWPMVLATGAAFIVADYRAASQPGMNFPDLPTIPRDRIIGHQHGGRAIGGVVTDVNAFRDDAFNYGGPVMGYLESRPARGNITAPFGAAPATPTSPPSHFGQDYGWGGGDAIYAARGGRVKSYGPSGSYGNRLVIDHGGGIETWYCHLSASVVGVGLQVVSGQQVAVMGATGNVTGKHLHFELRINGLATNPEPYFGGASTAGGSGTPIEEDELNDEQNNALMSVYKAVFAGGGDAGDAILTRLNNLERRLVNVDRQVTGADGFDPSVAGRVIDIQSKIKTGGVDIDGLAKQTAAAVVAALPISGGKPLTEEQVEAAVRRVFADAAD